MTTRPLSDRPFGEIPDAPRPEAEIIGRSVQGRPIEAIILGEGEKTILYLASIHGDESAGTPLVHEMVARLRRNPERMSGWRVVVVPVANPDGVAEDQRHNIRGVDLNRNFPAENREERARFGDSPLSESESRAIHDLINEERPARIVTLHQPLECVDYDGPGAEEIARRMAAVCHLPAKKLGARPGSLGAWAGETMGIPTITLELPREAGDTQSPVGPLWERYGEALLIALE